MSILTRTQVFLGETLAGLPAFWNGLPTLSDNPTFWATASFSAMITVYLLILAIVYVFEALAELAEHIWASLSAIAISFKGKPRKKTGPLPADPKPDTTIPYLSDAIQPEPDPPEPAPLTWEEARDKLHEILIRFKEEYNDQPRMHKTGTIEVMVRRTMQRDIRTWIVTTNDILNLVAKNLKLEISTIKGDKKITIEEEGIGKRHLDLDKLDRITQDIEDALGRVIAAREEAQAAIIEQLA